MDHRARVRQAMGISRHSPNRDTPPVTPGTDERKAWKQSPEASRTCRKCDKVFPSRNGMMQYVMTNTYTVPKLKGWSPKWIIQDR